MKDLWPIVLLFAFVGVLLLVLYKDRIFGGLRLAPSDDRAIDTDGDDASDGESLEGMPYRRRNWLLSKAERLYFVVLQQAVGDQYFIFPQVRLIDLLVIPKGARNRRRHKNKVINKHVDFVLCVPDTSRPVLVIELDDRSHQSETAKKRDAVKDAALKAAGLPLLRQRARSGYAVDEVRRVVGEKIG